MVGRMEEIKILNNLYNSKKAEFVAVYGRRRVGKAYLVDHVFQGRIAFRHAALSPVDDNKEKSETALEKQLEGFRLSLLLTGADVPEKFESWLQAFFYFEKYLQKIDDGSRQLVFIDELPWMDTPRSNFISAFESFWNSWACHRDNFMLVVCGSANSWMNDKLIQNHGGLFHRVTRSIELRPFTLRECELLLEDVNIRFSRYDIVQAYMVLGGVPFYFNYLDGNKSLAQNIDALFFVKNAPLNDEFNALFASAFTNPEFMKSIVICLGQRNAGLTRKELLHELGIKDGGTLSTALRGLLASDLIVKYIPFGGKKSDERYRLIDPFCIFYLKFVKDQSDINELFWEQRVSGQTLSSWRGIAYENICFHHVRSIKKALGISGVITRETAWFEKGEGSSKGAQIDLVIDRNDNIVNLCEMKYYSDLYEMDKADYLGLLHRQTVLESVAGKKPVVRPILITSFGAKDNGYSKAYTSVLTFDELFQD